ncbi:MULTISPECIES: hypothetical protein [Sorangium]|uniref:hypothetical protein n=1 Tax=Sorangium TaxID=39643 RepID=UPI003D9C4792
MVALLMILLLLGPCAPDDELDELWCDSQTCDRWWDVAAGGAGGEGGGWGGGGAAPAESSTGAGGAGGGEAGAGQGGAGGESTSGATTSAATTASSTSATSTTSSATSSGSGSPGLSTGCLTSAEDRPDGYRCDDPEIDWIQFQIDGSGRVCFPDEPSTWGECTPGSRCKVLRDGRIEEGRCAE